MNFAITPLENSSKICKKMLGNKKINLINDSNPISTTTRIKKSNRLSQRHRKINFLTFSYPSKYDELLCQDDLILSFGNNHHFQATKEQNNQEDDFVESFLKNLEAFQVYQLSENILDEEKLTGSDSEELPFELEKKKFDTKLARKTIVKRRKLQECQ